MEKTVCTVLLLSNVLEAFWEMGYGGNQPYISVSGKHVYVHDQKKWLEAQEFCRKHYTDLSSISSVREQQQLQRRGDGWINLSTWIGLYREPHNLTGWRWSGGGYATYLGTWDKGQPNNELGKNYGMIIGNTWYNVFEDLQKPFFCLKLIVVRESKTWEEALEHCREKHTDLTSLVSETELLLAQRESREAQTTTTHLWTGLRYLANRWLWVNGDPLEYEAWPQGGLHQCPAWNLRCGAITTEGAWEARDCQESLNFICY
ncbi:unnamed protein product [Oncorhynchus mykiss]|uniref:C-type lectin domain-containing protein n=1 Tax=Oncorhynchus mykiss TaxID=8022 RepID=A0A060WX94_ONCMY|nr:unnamed protein product [Oncorhynchus mykiss]